MCGEIILKQAGATVDEIDQITIDGKSGCFCVFTEEQIRRYIQTRWKDSVEKVEFDNIWGDYKVYLKSEKVST